VLTSCYMNKHRWLNVCGSNTTLDSCLTRHRRKHDRRGCARRIRGGRAVRRRLRRSIGERGGDGWGAAEGRGRGWRRVEPRRGVGWQQRLWRAESASASAGGVGVEGRGGGVGGGVLAAVDAVAAVVAAVVRTVGIGIGIGIGG